jgi:hypothetical protein
MARSRRTACRTELALLAGVGVSFLALAGCDDGKPAPHCATLAPVTLSGPATQQARTLATAMSRLGVSPDDPAFSRLGLALRIIEMDSSKPYGLAAAERWSDELGVVARDWRRAISHDCRHRTPATVWEEEIRSLQKTLRSEGVARDQGRKQEELDRKAAVKKEEEEKAAGLLRCKQAVIARQGAMASPAKKAPGRRGPRRSKEVTAALPEVKLDPGHYSRQHGRRGAILFLRQQGTEWSGETTTLNEEPGAVASQVDIVVRRESGTCLDMGDTDAAGRTVKQRVCGWQVEVTTCDVRTTTLLGQTRLKLDPPQELSVRGSIQASAERHLASELWKRLERLSWSP